MSISDLAEPTPEHVATLATTTARLPRFALIGVFGRETARAALIRARDGRILRVAVGDDLPQGKVAAIDLDQVILSRSGGTRILKLPAD